MNSVQLLRKAFESVGLEYKDQLPNAYNVKGHRCIGTCPICFHTGRDCHCSARKYWLWWIEQEKAKKLRDAAPDLLEALKDMMRRLPTLCGADPKALAAIAKAEGRAP